MKNKLPLSLALVFALSGCSTPLSHVANRVINLGMELPSDMVNTHLAGVVGFDEAGPGSYTRAYRNVLYSQGIAQGTPMYEYRTVLVNIAHTEGALYVKPGEQTFATAAVVPDSLPRLMAGDLIELRQTGTWQTMDNFVKTGEGNVVVRILCRHASSDFKACVAKAPKIGEVQGFGATGTTYPASAKGYGFTFTPWYTAEGKPLRSLPDAAPK